MDPLAQAFIRNNDANLFLLEHLSEKNLENRYSERTRTVAAQFAHIHNVRISHLERRGKDFIGKLHSFERGAQPKKSVLVRALTDSEAAIARFLDACATAGKVKSWNGPAASFLGYLIAHEAHHRALVILSMRLSGDKLPRDVSYSIWNWGKKGSLRDPS